MKKPLLTIVSIASIVVLSSAVIMRSTGIAGYTGAPGDSNCTSCHNAGTAVGTTSISATPAFTANQYVPGQTYTINVTCTHQTLSKFGFGCAVLNGTTTAAGNAGTITGISGSSKTLTSGSRKNAVHISTAAGSGTPFTKVFSFQWVAPQSGIAAIYAAGLAVNGNGNDGSGDAMKTDNLILTAASSGTTSTGISEVDAKSSSLSVFPNPSSGQLTIQYQAINNAEVSGMLYSLDGKEVAVLFKRQVSFGIHTDQVSFSDNLPAGAYMLRLVINGRQADQKMVIKY